MATDLNGTLSVSIKTDSLVNAGKQVDAVLNKVEALAEALDKISKSKSLGQGLKEVSVEAGKASTALDQAAGKTKKAGDSADAAARRIVDMKRQLELMALGATRSNAAVQVGFEKLSKSSTTLVAEFKRLQSALDTQSAVNNANALTAALAKQQEYLKQGYSAANAMKLAQLELAGASSGVVNALGQQLKVQQMDNEAAKRATELLKLQSAALRETKNNSDALAVAKMRLRGVSEANVQAFIAESAALRRVQQEILKTADDANRSANPFATIAKSFKSIVNFAVGFSAFNAIRTGILSFVEVATKIDQVALSLKTATGSSVAAEREFDRLVRTSERLAVPIFDTVKGYADFRIAAQATALSVNEINEAFDGFVIAGSGAQLPAEQFGGVMRAVTQIMSKGKVQAEELRGQLGDRLPGAFTLAAKSLGMTTAELDKALKKGEVSAETFVVAFSRMLKDTFGDAAYERINTFGGSIEDLKNAMKLFYMELANSGLKDLLISTFKGTAAVIRAVTGSFDELAAAFGAAKNAAITFAAAFALIKYQSIVTSLSTLALGFISVAKGADIATVATGRLGIALTFLARHPILIALTAIAAGIGYLTTMADSSEKAISDYNEALNASAREGRAASAVMDELANKDLDAIGQFDKSTLTDYANTLTNELGRIDADLDRNAEALADNRDRMDDLFVLNSERWQVAGFIKQAMADEDAMAAKYDVTKRKLEEVNYVLRQKAALERPASLQEIFENQQKYNEAAAKGTTYLKSYNDELKARKTAENDLKDVEGLSAEARKQAIDDYVKLIMIGEKREDQNKQSDEAEKARIKTREDGLKHFTEQIKLEEEQRKEMAQGNAQLRIAQAGTEEFIRLTQAGVSAKTADVLVTESQARAQALLLRAQAESIEKADPAEAARLRLAADKIDQDIFDSKIKRIQSTSEYLKDLQKETLSLDFGNNLANSLGKVADAFEGIGKAALSLKKVNVDYADKLEDIAEKQLLVGEGTKAYKDLGDAAEKLNRDQLATQLTLMGDVGQALQSTLREGSKEYKAMGVVISALQVAAGVLAVINQGTGDPYTAFARMAAMAAAVASLGVNIKSLSGGGGGGGGRKYNESGQAVGSVFGDKSAVSESIKNSSEITADATSELVGINLAMLQSMQAITAGIGGLSNIIARRQPGVDPGNLSSGQSFLNNSIGVEIGGALLNAATFGVNILTMGVSKLFGDVFGDFGLDIIGSIGDILSDIGGSVGNFLFGGSQKVTASGIRIIGGAINDMLEGGVADAYARIRTKKPAGRSSYSTQFGELDPQIAQQFDDILGNIVNTVREAALVLGMTEEQIATALNSVEIEELLINFKDKTPEEIEEALNAAFSNIFDEVALGVVAYIDEFARAGEGYAETLVRVASNVAVAREGLARLGNSIDVSNVIGAGDILSFTLETLGNGVTALIPSMQRSEAQTALFNKRVAEISTVMIDAAGGLSEFLKLTNDYIKDFKSESEQFAITTRDVNRAWDALNEANAGALGTLPATKEEFEKLIDSFVITDEASGRLYVQLLGLAPLFADMADSAAKLIKDVNDFNIAVGLGDKNKDLKDALGSVGLSFADVSAAAAGGAESFQQFLFSLTDAQKQGLLPVIDALIALNPELKELLETLNVDNTDAIRDFRKGIQDQIDAFGAADPEMFALRKRFEEMRAEARRLGDESLLPLISQLEQLEIAALAAARLKEFNDALRSTITNLQRQIAELRGNAGAFGLNAALGDLKRAGNYKEIFSAVGAIQSAVVAGMNEEIAAIEERKKAAIDAAKAQRDAQISSLEAQKEALEGVVESIEKLNEIAADLRQHVLDLRQGDMSILNPIQKLAEAQVEFQDLVNRAKAGDEEAAGKLTSQADDVLALAREVYASGSGYGQIFEDVTNSLLDVAGDLEQVPPEVAQLQMINAQLASLKASSDSIATSVGAGFDRQIEALKKQTADDLQKVADLLLTIKDIQKLAPEAQKAALQALKDSIADIFGIPLDDLIDVIAGTSTEEVDSVTGELQILGESVKATTSQVTKVTSGVDQSNKWLQQIFATSQESMRLLGTIASAQTFSNGASWHGLNNARLQEIVGNLRTQNEAAQIAAFATGAAFTNQVVAKPTTFNVGLMGEAGPEAIMPLTRTPEGNLGVQAVGSSNNPEMLVQLEQVSANTAAQVRVTAEAQKRTLILLESMDRRLEALENNGKLKKAGGM